jgi:chorismate lyase/3-hydroxybenzoate synthase
MLPRAQTLLAPPAWAQDWAARRLASLRSVVVPRAASASAEGLRHLAAAAVAQLLREIAASPFPHVARMWNFIPQIHATLDNGEDRYMAFNAGRHDAMASCFGPALAARVPAATGVGHPGEDLHIHAFALAQPGVPVNNPLQVPAYRYSARYGRLPPCFARATRTPHGLLISGTASIRGENTVAPDDLHRQLALTLENLHALTAGRPLKHPRAYVPPEVDREEVAAKLEEHFPDVEIIEADLCRRDLLVEIEGIVTEDVFDPNVRGAAHG